MAFFFPKFLTFWGNFFREFHDKSVTSQKPDGSTRRSKADKAHWLSSTQKMIVCIVLLWFLVDCTERIAAESQLYRHDNLEVADETAGVGMNQYFQVHNRWILSA